VYQDRSRAGDAKATGVAANRAPLSGLNTTATPISVNEPVTGTFEERAAARKQRTLLLRKQAEERIQEKQQLQATVDRSVYTHISSLFRSVVILLTFCFIVLLFNGTDLIYYRQKLEREAEEAESIRKEHRFFLIV
jgi:hypothetical protein